MPVTRIFLDTNVLISDLYMKNIYFKNFIKFINEIKTFEVMIPRVAINEIIAHLKRDAYSFKPKRSLKNLLENSPNNNIEEKSFEAYINERIDEYNNYINEKFSKQPFIIDEYPTSFNKIIDTSSQTWYKIPS